MKDISNNRTFNLTESNKINLEDYIHLYNNSNTNNYQKDQNEKLLIYVLTYNIHGSIPTKDQIHLLFPSKEKFEKFDVFVINTQECLRSISASIFVESKDAWILALSNFFGDKYSHLIDSTLGALHIIIFIKKEKAMNFHDLKSGEIKTGFLNIVANKGAVSASMKYFDKNILFICCHLASGHEEKEERNKDLMRIGNLLQNVSNEESQNKLKEIKNSLKMEKLRLSKTLKLSELHPINNNSGKKKVIGNSLFKIPSKTLKLKENEGEDNEIIKEDEKEEEKKEENNNNERYSTCKDLKENVNNELNNSFESILEEEEDKKDKIIEDYDLVILSGDLNYRLNLKKEEMNLIDKKDPEILWDKDQLSSEIKEKHNFREGIINFMPTYKFKDNSNEYDFSRIPGWTDRILYKSKKFYDIMLCEYSSINNISISDHKPVYAVFKIDCKNSVFVNNKFHKNEQECFII